MDADEEVEVSLNSKEDSTRPSGSGLSRSVSWSRSDGDPLTLEWVEGGVEARAGARSEVRRSDVERKSVRRLVLEGRGFDIDALAVELVLGSSMLTAVGGCDGGAAERQDVRTREGGLCAFETNTLTRFLRGMLHSTKF